MSLPAVRGYQFKASPFPGAAASFGGIDPAAGDPADPAAQQAAEEQVEQHEWAGDLFEEGTESNPADAFARFHGGAGEEAWLDRAEDGTLTGWVRDTDGSVYRYSDVEAWAVDTDEATMTRVDPGQEPAESPEGDEGDEEAAEGEEEAAEGEEDPSLAADGEVPTDDPEALAEEADLEEEVTEDAASLEEDAEELEDDLSDEADAADSEESEESEEEDDDWRKRLEGKSLLSLAPAHRWNLTIPKG